MLLILNDLKATKVIEQLYNKDAWPLHGLFNINVPVVADVDCPVHITRFHQANYGSLFKPLDQASPKDGSIEAQVRLDAETTGALFRFAPDIKAMSSPNDALPGSDAWAIQQKYISGRNSNKKGST